jgi:hypothetical protein
MSEKRKDDERIQRIRHKYEIYQQAFLNQGTMVAFPLCFPGASAPIPGDESHITALDVTNEGFVYGGTSGRRTHLFVGIVHAATGMVFDLGVVEGASHCAAVCCGQTKFAACVNGKAGGRIVTGAFQAMPYDLLQEWGFARRPLEECDTVAENERILHAVAAPSREYAIGVTEKRLFSFDIESGGIEVIDELEGRARIAFSSKDSVLGFDEGNTLWRYDLGKRRLMRRAIELPDGSWMHCPKTWAQGAADGGLFVADDDGTLYGFDEDTGFTGPLARVPLTPVGPMATTFDGRLFGFCGDGIAKMYCYDPAAREMKELGGAVSVIEKRRYGFQFAAAVTGRDGQIIFGEDDDLGHLWLYFPSIRKPDSP